MPINENLLWSRTLLDGKIVKEPTFLGAVLIGLALFAGVALWMFLAV